MLEFITNNFANITSLLITLIAVIGLVITSIFTAKGWWRQRNIYKIELHEIRADLISTGLTGIETNEINKKIGSGEYTIMHTEKDFGGYHILLGKIKK
jgi:hypothetical protein